MQDHNASKTQAHRRRSPSPAAGRPGVALICGVAAAVFSVMTSSAFADEKPNPASANPLPLSADAKPRSAKQKATAPTTTSSIKPRTNASRLPSGNSELDEAMSQGYVDNPSISASRAGQIVLDEGVAQAIAALRPSLTATGSAGRVTENRYMPDSTTRRRPESLGVSASLLLFDGFASFNTVRASQARAEAGRYGLSDAEQRLLSEIAGAYANVWRDRSIVALERRNVGFLSELRRSAKRRLELGDLSRTDLAQADSRYNGARANLASARALLVASEATFTELVGLPPSKVATPKVPGSLFPRTLDAALAVAAKNNPLIKKAKADETAADRDVDARIGAFFPKVTVDTSYDKNTHTSTSYKSSREVSTFVRVNFPFYDGGAKESRYRAAKALSIQRSYERAATKRGVWSSVRTLWSRRVAAKARISAARRQLVAAELAVRGLTKEAKAGLRSVIDILDGQRERVTAKIALARARADYVTTSYQLLAALGKSTPQYLGLPVEPYDATTRLTNIKRSWLGLFVQ